MRSIPCLLAFGVLVAVPARVSAQQQTRGSCPPGAWFCDDAESAGEDSGSDEASPDGGHEGDEGGAAEPRAGRSPRGSRQRAPSVIVVSPGDEPPPKVVVLQKGTEAPPPPVTRPHRRFFREAGINLRLEGVLMGNDDRTRARNSGMGGVGVSFRYRPVPHFAFDVGLDFLGGRDWNGFRRSETALLLSGIIFVNPYSPVQFYLLGGFGFSGADVNYRGTQALPGGGMMTIDEQRGYSYFGAHFGPGLEFRVGRRVALNLDVIGFVRGRTDRHAASEPEFVDPNDPTRTTNTSGGGLLRGGITFYW
jgi:hypothetical protein